MTTTKSTIVITLWSEESLGRGWEHGRAAGVTGDMLRVDLGGGYHDIHLPAGFSNSALLTFRPDNSWLGDGGCPMYHKMFGNSPGLHPLDDNNSSPPPHHDNPKMFPDIVGCPLRPKSPLIGNGLFNTRKSYAFVSCGFLDLVLCVYVFYFTIKILLNFQ